MDISELRAKINQSIQEISTAEGLQQRCERMFPGVAVKIEYGEDGHASLIGLTPEQLQQLMAPWA